MAQGNGFTARDYLDAKFENIDDKLDVLHEKVDSVKDATEKNTRDVGSLKAEVRVIKNKIKGVEPKSDERFYSSPYLKIGLIIAGIILGLFGVTSMAGGI